MWCFSFDKTIFRIDWVPEWEVCILKSFIGFEVGLWIENSKRWKVRSFECLKENRAFGWHFTSKLDRRVEQVSEVKKIKASSIGMFGKENMPLINLFQTKGFSGLATSSRFSRSTMKIMEKATTILVPIAMPWVYTKCFSLNLKEFS